MTLVIPFQVCVAQPENMNEPVYASCLDFEEIVRLTQAKTAIKKDNVEKEEDDDETDLYFNKRR